MKSLIFGLCGCYMRYRKTCKPNSEIYFRSQPVWSEYNLQENSALRLQK